MSEKTSVSSDSLSRCNLHIIYICVSITHGVERLSCALRIAFANLCATYFAADCFGQLFYKLDYAGVFVGSCDTLHVILQFLNQFRTCLFLIVLRQDDGCLYDLPTHFVGHASDGAFNYGGVGH